MRILYIAAVLSLSACQTAAVKTFGDVTQDVNDEFVLGQQLRDRCRTTGDLDHCIAWNEYKKSEEADNPLMDYDKALARWEQYGPY